MTNGLIVGGGADAAGRLDRTEPPAPGHPAEGEAIFAREGCGLRHTICGTEYVGRVGPDLTHIGCRLTLDAGRLGTNPDDFADWVAHTADLKRG